MGTIDDNETFISGSSVHDGFNIGIGVYGTSNLTIIDNVLHFTVGPCIDLQGENNKLIHNLASRSVAESTYKVTFNLQNQQCEDEKSPFYIWKVASDTAYTEI